MPSDKPLKSMVPEIYDKPKFDKLLIFSESYKLKEVNLISLSEYWKIENANNFNITGFTTTYNGSEINQHDYMLIFIDKIWIMTIHIVFSPTLYYT